MKTAPPESTAISNGLATTRWLTEHLVEPWLRIVDVRRSGTHAHLFIPGSTKLEVARLLRHDGAAVSGAETAMAMSELGVGDEHWIVLVDEGNVEVAQDIARVLRRYGHEATTVLSGGFPRWLLERRPVATTLAHHPFASFTARMSPAPSTRRSSNRRAS